MKKREILSLINAKKVIQKNKELLFIVKSHYDFILDEKNKEELKHIRFNEEHLIKRKYMNTLRRYALAINETRGWSKEENYISDIYDKRLQSLKSDLPAVRDLLIKAEKELAKNDNADFEKVIERVTKCRKKLKKFIKRYEQLSLDKISKEH